MRNSSILFYFLAILVICSALLSATPVKMSASDHQEKVVAGEPPEIGGIREITEFKKDPALLSELQELARFAVDEHNKNQSTEVEYVRVLKAKEQIVGGKMYYLTVAVVEVVKDEPSEVEEGEDVRTRVYEAKLWVQSLNDFKQLQEFTHIGDQVCGISAAQAAAGAARAASINHEEKAKEEEAIREREMLAGIHEIEGFKKDPVLCSELHELGRFAVDEHNKKQNADADYMRVVQAKEQTVTGKTYYLTVEVGEDAKKRVYEAKVLVQLGNDFKQLQEFTYLGDSICGISPSQPEAPGDGAGQE